jgi:hypothetical protein
VSSGFALPDPFGAALDSTGSGGWAAIIGKSRADLLTTDDVTLIGNYVFNKISSDPLFFAMKNNPLTGGAATSQLMAVSEEVRRTLSTYVGRPLAEVPNDLRSIDAIRNSYGVDSVTTPIQGLADDLVQGLRGTALLLGIVAMGLLGLYLTFRPKAGGLANLTPMGRILR